MNYLECSPVWEDSSLFLMARLEDVDGSNAVQADVSAISLGVHDRDDPDTITTTAPAVVGTIFNTLQTDARWTLDSTGYNFRYEVSPAQIPDGEAIYRFEFKVTYAGGAISHLVWDIPTRDLARS